MQRLFRHVFWRTAVVFTGVLLLLTGIVWVTQALRRFDLVTAKGQAVVAYLTMTGLAIPFLISIIIPFALVIAVALVLYTMHADSELTIVSAAGVSPRQLVQPFFMISLTVTFLLGWLSLSAAPMALQELRDRTNRLRADIVTNVIQPGRFTDLDEGITFHIRNRGGDGALEGLFIRDTRDSIFGFTYTAERGRIMETLGRTFVVMENGTIERERLSDGASAFIAFDSYAFDLSNLQPDGKPAPYKASERSLIELITAPTNDPYRASNETIFRAEIHGRLANLLYPTLMLFVVFLALGFPKTTRRGRGLALFFGLLLASLVRIVGFTITGLAAKNTELLPLISLLPFSLILLTGGAIFFGFEPRAPRFLLIFLEKASHAARQVSSRFALGERS